MIKFDICGYNLTSVDNPNCPKAIGVILIRIKPNIWESTRAQLSTRFVLQLLGQVLKIQIYSCNSKGSFQTTRVQVSVHVSILEIVAT